MASVESPVSAPRPGWARRFPRDERVFVWAIVASTIVMAVFVIVWLYAGSQNVPTTYYSTTPSAFMKDVQRFVDRFGTPGGKVYVPPGQDAYLVASRYSWYPELALQAGTTYRIWISSADALHGFSLVGGGQNLNLEIAPNHAYGPKLAVGDPGRYLIVCNEYCGLHHHEMRSFIDVVTPAVMASKVRSGAEQRPAAAPAPVTSAGPAIALEADPNNALKFDKTALTAKAGKVTIRMANPSVLPHNVAIKGKGVDVKGKVVLKGGVSTASAVLKPGSYTFYCSVPGHAAAGMKGTLTVTP